MKITFSSIAVFALAIASGTLAAPVKPQSKGHTNLSADNVATLKKWGWLSANYTAPVGGFGRHLVPLEPTSIKIVGPVKGPSKSPSNNGSGGTPPNYICETSRSILLEWFARIPKVGGDDDHYNKITEHGFEISVSTKDEYGVIMDGARSKGSSPDYRETRRSWDKRFDVTHDKNYNNGRLILETNGQKVDWQLVGKYALDEDERYIYIYNYVHACFNWPW